MWSEAPLPESARNVLFLAGMLRPRSHQLELLVTLGARQYVRCLVGPGRYDLGQGRMNEITVDEASVSSRHARLTIFEEGDIYIQDTGSANGTFVDDEFAQEPLLVRCGSQVQVGACRLEVRERVLG